MDLGEVIRKFPLRTFRGLYITCVALAALTAVGAIRSGNPALLVVPVIAAALAFAWTFRAYRWLEIREKGVVLRTMLARYEAPWSDIVWHRHGEDGLLESRGAPQGARMRINLGRRSHYLYEHEHDGFFTIKREYRGRALLDEIDKAMTMASRPAA
jgi:hypothetical protein